MSIGAKLFFLLMTKIENIAVVSTFATDRLIDSKTGWIINEQKGGPILYLIQALEKLGLKPEVYSGKELLVEILIEESDEFGSIKETPQKAPLPDIKSSSAIVSTLLNEWDLSNAKDYKGKLFVDIQGYVRDGSDFGKKKAWDEVRVLASHIFCLKGNDVEIAQLPEDVVLGQKRERMLIITKDKRGVDIYYKGRVYNLEPDIIVKPKHTIGAGDTFFANFVYEFLSSGDIESATKFALDKTSNFLSAIK